MKDDPLHRPLPDSFDPPAPTPVPVRGEEYAWAVAVATFLWLGMSAAALWFVVPKFAEVFEQVKVPLPSLTTALVNASRIACEWPVPVGLGVVVAAFWSGRCKGRCRRAAAVLIPLALTLTVATFFVALFSPLVGSLESFPARRAEFRCGPAHCR